MMGQISRLCVVLGSVLLAVAVWAAGPFTLNGRVVTVRTARYCATIENGCLTSLTNELTGEVYAQSSPDLAQRLPAMVHGMGIVSPSDFARLAGQLSQVHGWGSGYDSNTRWPFFHHPTVDSHLTMKQLSANRVLVTWSGLQAYSPDRFIPEESYSLELAVLPNSGDLAITARVQSPTGGVLGVGFPMANFSRDLTFIRPVCEGSSMVPRQQPLGTSVYMWPAPWMASMMVAQGGKGSVGMWMEDPQLRPRYLHTRNNAGSYDVIFESLNDAPFDAQTQAVSRPMRLNVYRGNWIQAARPFKTWWASTFEVQPIVQRHPDWLQRIRWIVHWSAPPSAEYGPKTIYFAPQCWKIGPSGDNIDGGLFPDDMTKGPQLNGWEKSLKTLQDIGSHPMVYLNIDYMNKNHALAPQFWPYRQRPPFDLTAGKETEPGPGSPGAFIVNSAYRPWQDMIVNWAKQTYDRYGITGFYMDCASGNPNWLNGVIDGKNDCQGQVALMKRIKAEIPGAFLDVEYLNEVTAQATDFGSTGFDSWWPGSQDARQRTVHPIIGYLFGDYAYLHYISPPSLPGFDEVMGRLSQASVPDPLDPGSITDYSATEDYPTFRAHLMCKTHMKAVYPDDWDPAVRAYYADPSGSSYRILAENPDEARMVKRTPQGAESLVYWRIKGRDHAELTPGTGIEGWVAYHGDTAIGLDPAKEYLYSGKPRIADWQVTQLPEGTIIDRCRPYRNGLLVLELKSRDGQPHDGIAEVGSAKPLLSAITGNGTARLTAITGGEAGLHTYQVPVQVPGMLVVSTQSVVDIQLPPMGKPAVNFGTFQPADYAYLTPDGVREPIPANHLLTVDPGAGEIRLFPGWTHDGAIDYCYQLPQVPSGKHIIFTASTNVPHDGNSYQFVLRVNGKELLRETRTGKQGETKESTADLTPYAGQSGLITLGFEQCYLFDWIRVTNAKISVR